MYEDQYYDDDVEPQNAVTTQVGPLAMVPVWVLRKGLTGAELAVYVALRSFADRCGEAYPRSKTIAARAGVHEVTVRKAITRLRELDLVRTEKWHRSDGSVGGLIYHMRDLPRDEECETDATEGPSPVAGQHKGCSPAATRHVAPRLQQKHTNRTHQENYWSPPAETSSTYVETFSASGEKTPDTPQRRRRAQQPAQPAQQDALEGIVIPEPPQPTANPVQAMVGLYATTVTQAGGVPTSAHLAAIGRNVKLRLKEGIPLELIEQAVIKAAHRGHKGIDTHLAAPQPAQAGRRAEHEQIAKAQAALAERIGPDGDSSTVLDMIFG